MPFRWDQVEPYINSDGKEMKYYRDRFTADTTVKKKLMNSELDKPAYDELGSELETYKIMDLNATAIIEERGDLSRIEKVEVPAI